MQTDRKVAENPCTLEVRRQRTGFAIRQWIDERWHFNQPLISGTAKAGSAVIADSCRIHRRIGLSSFSYCAVIFMLLWQINIVVAVKPSCCTRLLTAWRKWTEQPFTLKSGKTTLIAWSAASSKSVRNVRVAYMQRRRTLPQMRHVWRWAVPCTSLLSCWATEPTPAPWLLLPWSRGLCTSDLMCRDTFQMCRRRWCTEYADACNKLRSTWLT